MAENKRLLGLRVSLQGEGRLQKWGPAALLEWPGQWVGGWQPRPPTGWSPRASEPRATGRHTEWRREGAGSPGPRAAEKGACAGAGAKRKSLRGAEWQRPFKTQKHSGGWGSFAAAQPDGCPLEGAVSLGLGKPCAKVFDRQPGPLPCEFVTGRGFLR